MAFSYDPSLSSDKDWARFKLGDIVDTSSQPAQLQDEEIEAILLEESNKWLAIAELLQILFLRWSSAGRGEIEKQVGRLRIRRGLMADFSAVQAIEERIRIWREKGNRLASPKSSLFRSL